MWGEGRGRKRDSGLYLLPPSAQNLNTHTGADSSIGKGWFRISQDKDPNLKGGSEKGSDASSRADCPHLATNTGEIPSSLQDLSILTR